MDLVPVKKRFKRKSLIAEPLGPRPESFFDGPYDDVTDDDMREWIGYRNQLIGALRESKIPRDLDTAFALTRWAAQCLVVTGAVDREAFVQMVGLQYRSVPELVGGREPTGPRSKLDTDYRASNARAVALAPVFRAAGLHSTNIEAVHAAGSVAAEVAWDETVALEQWQALAHFAWDMAVKSLQTVAAKGGVGN